jgi:cobaltochelatase CobS
MTALATKESETRFPLDAPDTTISVRETFGIDSDLEVPACSIGEDHVRDLRITEES